MFISIYILQKCSQVHHWLQVSVVTSETNVEGQAGYEYTPKKLIAIGQLLLILSMFAINKTAKLTVILDIRSSSQKNPLSFLLA